MSQTKLIVVGVSMAALMAVSIVVSIAPQSQTATQDPTKGDEPQSASSTHVQTGNETYPQLAFPENTLDTTGWKEYVNEQYGFRFKYPPDWSIDSWKGACTTASDEEFSIVVRSPKTKLDFPIGTKICVGNNADILNEFGLVNVQVKQKYQSGEFTFFLYDVTENGVWKNFDIYILEMNTTFFEFIKEGAEFGDEHKNIITSFESI